ncbi:MAG: DUF6421 family protein [Methylococcales bacterium]
MQSLPALLSLKNLTQLVDHINGLRQLQEVHGCVVRNDRHAHLLLNRIVEMATDVYRACGQDAMIEALMADANNWCRRGLSTPPAFDKTRESYQAPQTGNFSYFCGVTQTANSDSDGHRLECFLALRDEPPILNAVAKAYPYSSSAINVAHLVRGSDGFEKGNCIVFFPENIRSRLTVSRQSFALFFFNKFHTIYHEQTLPLARLVFGQNNLLTGTGWRSETLSPEECYAARCIWGYLHDYFHHHGPRPLNTNLHVKLRFFTGLLEELKCDSQVLLAACQGDIPHAVSIAEFVLFERLLRYPNQKNRTSNVDSGSGLFMWLWLKQARALRKNSNGFYCMDRPRMVQALQSLVLTLEELELQDDASYLTGAKSFVQKYLPPSKPSDANAKFSIPSDYDLCGLINRSSGS